MVNTLADDVDTMVYDQPIAVHVPGQEMSEHTPRPQPLGPTQRPQPAGPAPRPRTREPHPRPLTPETHPLGALAGGDILADVPLLGASPDGSLGKEWTSLRVA